jgi:hypothetical protein
MSHFFRILVLAVLVTGCKPNLSEPGASSQVSTNGTLVVLDHAKVLAIAREAVATNDTWLDRAEFETPERQADGTWSVLVWRVPKVPGGHRLITIDDKGKIKNYIRGR